MTEDEAIDVLENMLNEENHYSMPKGSVFWQQIEDRKTALNMAITALIDKVTWKNNSCYKVIWNEDINSYTIKVINSSERMKNDENTYSNLEDAEKKLKELQTGEIPHRTSPKEFEEKMLDAIKRADGSPEEYHGDMDWIMCNLLRELGYGKGIDVFQSVEKWYA